MPDAVAENRMEERLRSASGLDFRYIGAYSADKVFCLHVYSEMLARELCTALNGFIHDYRFRAAIAAPERYTGSDTVEFSFPRWRLVVPQEAVTDTFLETMVADGFIPRVCAPLLNDVRDRFYDVITAAANAASSKRLQERDFIARSEAWQQRKAAKLAEQNGAPQAESKPRPAVSTPPLRRKRPKLGQLSKEGRVGA